MLETYKVGVVLELGGNVQTGIDRLIAEMEKLDRGVNDAGARFRKLAEDIGAIGRAGRSIGTLSRTLERLGSGTGSAGLDRMATAAQSMTTASERLTTVLRTNAELAAGMARSVEAAARASRVAPGGGAAGGRGGGHRGLGGHDMLYLGMGAQMVSEPLMRGGESAIERAMGPAHLRQQITADRRVSEAQADAMVNSAYAATTTAPGSRVEQNLHALIDLKNTLGSLEEAEAMLPRFAQLSTLLQLMDRKRGGRGDSAFAAARAMELMGGMIEEREVDGHTERTINPALMQNRLDMMMRVAVATNARVAPEDYLRFAQQARVAGMNLSDDFIYTRLPAIMLGMGGSRAGTALMSMAQVFEGGKLTAKSMEALQEIGLAGPGGIEMQGRRKIVHPEEIYDLSMLRTDPDKWTLLAQQRMESKGIHGTADQITALMRAAQRTTIAGGLADFLKDAPTIERERQNIVNTKPDVFQHFAQNDPAAKLQQMQAAFDKLLTTFGSAAMEDATRLMNAVTNGLNRLSDWAEKNPNMARLLTDAAIGLGAIGTALGTLSTAIFFFGPALRALGIVGGGAAAAGGGGLLGAASRAAMGAGAAGLGAVGAGAAVVGGSLILGGTTDPIRAEQQLQQLSRERRGDPMQAPIDGFGGGIPLPPKPQDMNVQLRGDVNVDGRKLGEIAASGIAKSGGAASGGMTGFDLRASPMSPGGVQ